jgi:hypothetical protein
MADSTTLSRLPLVGAALVSGGSPDANKVPLLNSSGKIDPSMFSSTLATATVSDQAGRLAYPNLIIGNFVLQTDNNTLYVLNSLPSSNNSNWSIAGTAITYPVTRVAGKTGDITLSASDISGLSTAIISGSAVKSVNTRTDVVSLTSDDIPESTGTGTHNLYFTNSRAAGAAPVQTVAGRAGNVVLSKTDISGLPAFGTAATINFPASGNAGATEAVLGNDTRLSIIPPYNELNIISRDINSNPTSIALKNEGVTVGTLNQTYTNGKLTNVVLTDGTNTIATWSITYDGSGNVYSVVISKTNP